MRPWVKEFVRMAAESFALRGPVYEFGSYLVDSQHELANLRGYFAGQPYVGCDQRPGPGVDRIEDLAHLTLADASAQTILCLDTLEHVFEVRRAVDEMIRVLAPGGFLLCSVPFDFQVHAFPDDYWRLTPSCLERLLAPLEGALIGALGTESRPHTVLALAGKAPLPAHWPAAIERLTARYHDWLCAVARGPHGGGGWRQWATGWMLTRRERRRRREYFDVRFASRWPLTLAAGSGPMRRPANSSGRAV